MPPFYTYKQYMMDTYGAPLHRVPIDLGLGCPNRNEDGSGGCFFCPADGSRAKYTADLQTLKEQVEGGLAFARKRYKAERFMAYIQAFTGTFAPASEQRKIYSELLGMFKFDALSIGTRPDCLSDSTLEYLQELNREIDLYIELGVQTVHNRTLERVNRGHDWESSKASILRLHELNIKTIVHVIIGLPDETPEDFNTTAETLSKLPLTGIKIHNLHVMRGTQLAREYTEAPFKIYDEYEYADILIGFIRRLPANIAIVRINTDTADEELIAPRWKMQKGQFREYVIEQMKNNGFTQGDLFRFPSDMSDTSD